MRETMVCAILSRPRFLCRFLFLCMCIRRFWCALAAYSGTNGTYEKRVTVVSEVEFDRCAGLVLPVAEALSERANFDAFGQCRLPVRSFFSAGWVLSRYPSCRVSS